MRTIRLCLALLLLSAASTTAAQTAPANVVTPSPPPREGTVGPEQLRDFALPGTRTTPAPAPSPATTAPPAAPVDRPVPARPTSPARDTRPAPAPPPAPRSESPRPQAEIATERARSEAPGLPSPSPGGSDPVAPPLATPQPAIDTPLPPPAPAATAPAGQETTLRIWWAWLIVAGLLGVALAVVLRRRGRAEGVAGAAGVGGHERAASRHVPPVPEPAAPSGKMPVPGAEPPLPAGLVTTRLRAPATAPVPQAAPAQSGLPGGIVSTRLRAPAEASPPAIPAGAVTSSRLRPWVQIDAEITELLLTENEADLQFRIRLDNSGSASARDIVIEALALNAGESQESELATFFERVAGNEVAIGELPRLGSAELTHRVRMPRAAIRAYEVQGRRVFVPILAFNVSYASAAKQGRTSAAFLVGHRQEGSKRLAPLTLAEGERRLSSLGVRRLENEVRR